MNVSDVKSFYKLKKSVDLAEKLGVSPVTIVNWGKHGIPYNQQCVFYFESKHKLKPNKQEVEDAV